MIKFLVVVHLYLPAGAVRITWKPSCILRLSTTSRNDHIRCKYSCHVAIVCWNCLDRTWKWTSSALLNLESFFRTTCFSTFSITPLSKMEHTFWNRQANLIGAETGHFGALRRLVAEVWNWNLYPSYIVITGLMYTRRYPGDCHCPRLVM